MLSRLASAADRVLDRWVPNITASALTALPQGCAPECLCGYSSHCSGCKNSKGLGCTYECITLACTINYYCNAGVTGPCNCTNCTDN